MEAIKIDWGIGSEKKSEEDVGLSLREEPVELEELKVFGNSENQKPGSRTVTSTKKGLEEESGFDSSELSNDEFESSDEEVSRIPLTSHKTADEVIEFYQNAKREEVGENVREHNSGGSTGTEEKFEESRAVRNSKKVGRVDARGIPKNADAAKVESEVVPIVVREPSVAATATDAAKFLALSARFEKGREIAVCNETTVLMSFLEVGGELMAFRVFDPNPVVRIPAYVADLPVKYIHPEFLKGGLTPFSGIKFESVKSLFNSDKIVGLNRNSFQDSLKGAKAVELPNTLTSLPPRIFEKCLNLKSIVIPASVTAVSNRAFSYSCFSDIWFEGACPMNFLNNSYMPRNVKIHVKKEFLSSYVGEEAQA